MRKRVQYECLREWWEFQYLYHHFSSLPSQIHDVPPLNEITSTNLIKQASQPQSHLLDKIHHSQNISLRTTSKLNSKVISLDLSSSITLSKQKTSAIGYNKRQTPFISPVHQPKMHNSRQSQNKRQREWIYLSHYLAVSGLNPIYVISGTDDGREPDFTLVFYHDYRLYYVGVELTTLPRLRDRMGDEDLIAKRWYWQALQQMARLREKKKESYTTEHLIQSYDRFRLPLQTLYMPKAEFAKRPTKKSMITQKDINEVMDKKSHKVDAYHTRRPLQELWLLVHTDKYQPNSILTAPDNELVHESGFNQIHITRYPSHKLISIKKL